MIRTAIAAALFAVALLAAAPAHAEPEPTPLQGQAVCALVQSSGVRNAGIQLELMHPDWSASDAGHFIAVSLSTYCPGTDL